MSKETEAIIELMCLAANADGVVQPIENFVIISKISTYTNVFKQDDKKKIVQVQEGLIKKFREGQTLDEIINNYDTIISSKLKTTAFAYALEVCARDFQLHSSEIEFLKKLSSKFNIPKSTIQALLKSINIRCKTNFETTDIF